MLVSTGVIVHIRDSGKEYGMHEGCADLLITSLLDAGYSVVSNNMPAVIIGPLFSNFACAYSVCAAR